MSHRTYDDYSTFSAGESMWFAADQDVRICCNGIVLNGDFRSDVLTCNGSRGLGGPLKIHTAPKPPRARKLPMVYLPPKRG